MNASDEPFLRVTIALAEQGRFTCAPNPPVGCVVVKDGRIVGRGFHQRAGEGHAEVNALADAADQVPGSTVYVSLEPCAFEGRTPACAKTLVQAGVARVVAAAWDPHPQVSGAGMQILRDAGIPADLIAMPEAARVISGFATRITRGRPFVRIKTASSLDGAIALASGESQWITGEAARDDVQYWRARSDAVITGIGTVRADNPRLTARKFPQATPPLRVVLDATASIDPESTLLNDGGATLVVHHADASPAEMRDAAQWWAHDTRDLAGLLNELADRGCNEVLVEAGPRLVGSFIAAGLWDEWIAYVAPKFLGSSVQQVLDLKFETLQDALQVNVRQIKHIGKDVRMMLRPREENDEQ